MKFYRAHDISGFRINSFPQIDPLLVIVVALKPLRRRVGVAVEHTDPIYAPVPVLTLNYFHFSCSTSNNFII